VNQGVRVHGPNLGFLLKDVSRRFAKRLEERAHHLSLTLQECRTLMRLAENEGTSQKRLAEITQIDPMSLVRILDRMEKHGWVRRRPDPSDRRARSLFLTDRAQPILLQIDSLVTVTREEAFKDLSSKDRAVLLEMLERVHATLSGLTPIAAARPGRRSGTLPRARVG